MATPESVIKAIVAVEPAITEPYSKISDEQGEYIAGLFEGDFTLFEQLDEQPGRFTSPYYHGTPGCYGYETWHWKLRQARNYCPMFFAILNSEGQGGRR